MERKVTKLEGLSEKIFLDRYALKDEIGEHFFRGNTVIVQTLDDPKFPKKEVGEIVGVTGEKYQVKLRNGEVIDTTKDKMKRAIETTPEHLWDRLATAISAVEVPEKQDEWREKFRDVLDDWKLVPAGRIAAGAGTNEQLTLFNCYVIPSPKDSRGGIMATLSEMTEIMSRGGGVGVNLSSLRPRRGVVRGVNGSSSGSVSWGGLFSYTTGLIEQGGSRRGALMLMLNDWHPDIMEFITIKQKKDLITNANLSIGISNGFMKAVKEDLDWNFIFPDTSDPEYDEVWDGDMEKWQRLGKPIKIHKTMKAREIWDEIIESAWKSAEPGIVFIEHYNDLSNSWYFNKIVCTNPCAEQGLPAWGVCNLSSINLAKFVADGEVDWEALAETVRISVRFLDNVIDATPYHFQQNKDNQMNERRIGLGTMGLAEMLIKLKIRYGGEESIEFLDKLYNFIAREGYLASSEIAKEKGSFLKFDEQKYLQSQFIQQFDDEVKQAISTNGMRNVTVLTQAPTGSTGTMVGTSTGIEPYFAFEYIRQSRLGNDKQYVPIAKEWVEANPGKRLPDYFVTAMELSAREHIIVQATIQKWVDSSISKTANAPSDFTVEDTKELYEYAYKLGCKGVTIYRDGSRDEQVLSLEEKEDESEEVKVVQSQEAKKLLGHRPKKLVGATYRMVTPLGKAYITINDVDGMPYEVFVNVGKAGSDVFAMSEALGRVTTLFLRFGEVPGGNKEKLLIKHLKGIGGSGAVGFGENRVESIGDAVAKAIETHMGFNDHTSNDNLNNDDNNEDNEGQQKVEAAAKVREQKEIGFFIDNSAAKRSASDSLDLCPTCGSASLVNEENCKHCISCGYTRCT
jgi:ribonucleoside-diphosphate reductase alpha chain